MGAQSMARPPPGGHPRPARLYPARDAQCSSRSGRLRTPRGPDRACVLHGRLPRRGAPRGCPGGLGSGRSRRSWPSGHCRAAPQDASQSPAPRCSRRGPTLSIAWAPLSGAALDDAQRTLLYLGALIAAAAFLVPGRPVRALEPALAAGALLTVCYGLSERLLPWLVELDRSESAAAGSSSRSPTGTRWVWLAAIGLILAAQAGRRRLQPSRRSAAARRRQARRSGPASTSPSRAARWWRCWRAWPCSLCSCPGAAQLVAIGVTLGAAVLASVCVGAVPLGARPRGQRQPAASRASIALVLLVAVAAGAALITRASRRRGASSAAAAAGRAAGIRCSRSPPRWSWPSASPWWQRTRPGPTSAGRATGATPSRLVSVDSNRYEYWRVALDVFGEHPLRRRRRGRLPRRVAQAT